MIIRKLRLGKCGFNFHLYEIGKVCLIYRVLMFLDEVNRKLNGDEMASVKPTNFL